MSFQPKDVPVGPVPLQLVGRMCWLLSLIAGWLACWLVGGLAACAPAVQVGQATGLACVGLVYRLMHAVLALLAMTPPSCLLAGQRQPEACAAGCPC